RGARRSPWSGLCVRSDDRDAGGVHEPPRRWRARGARPGARTRRLLRWRHSVVRDRLAARDLADRAGPPGRGGRRSEPGILGGLGPLSGASTGPADPYDVAMPRRHELGFRTGSVRVRVPATSANLGPGFDALGLALGIYDEVTARVADGGVRVRVTGEGA